MSTEYQAYIEKIQDTAENGTQTRQRDTLWRAINMHWVTSVLLIVETAVDTAVLFSYVLVYTRTYIWTTVSVPGMRQHHDITTWCVTQRRASTVLTVLLGKQRSTTAVPWGTINSVYTSTPAHATHVRCHMIPGTWYLIGILLLLSVHSCTRYRYSLMYSINSNITRDHS